MSQPERKNEVGFTDSTDCELILIEGGGDTTVRPTRIFGNRSNAGNNVDGKICSMTGVPSNLKYSKNENSCGTPGY